MFSIASHETSGHSADDLYLWTDEGRVLPPVIICDRRTDDAFLEAMAQRGALHTAIAAAVLIGIFALAGSVGLSRVEHATIIAERV